ncbi:MAG: sigma-70 family RNA polymerase sigma factor [Pseudonocardiaceae bacterium]
MISAVQGGDRDAFGQLYARYAPEVSRFVGSRVGGDRSLAEDLTSETFTRALRSVGSVSDQGRDVGAWFTTIARNLIFDHYKSSRAKLERATPDPQHAAPPVLDERSPERVVLQGETAREVRAAVAELTSPAQRECIRLRFWEDRSIAETAEAMERAPGAVKSLTRRALVGLRAQLARGGERVPAPRETPDPIEAARHAVAVAHQQVIATGQAGADHRQADRPASWDASERGIPALGDADRGDDRAVLGVA